MKRILSIDYGRSHVGLAMADTPLAEPLQTVATEHVMAALKEIVAQHGISDIVLGRSEGAMQTYIEAFADELAKFLGLPIHWQDETLSSHETRVALARSGMAKRKREKKIDHHVAAHILQEFLDDHPDFW